MKKEYEKALKKYHGLLIKQEQLLRGEISDMGYYIMYMEMQFAGF